MQYCGGTVIVSMKKVLPIDGQPYYVLLQINRSQTFLGFGRLFLRFLDFFTDCKTK